MRKLLYILLLLPFLASAQGVLPAGSKPTNSQMYIHLPDSSVYLNQGFPYGVARLSRYSDITKARIYADSANGDYYKYTQAVALKLFNGGKINIACYGNSLTDGLNPSGPNTSPRTGVPQTLHPYPDMLSAALNTVYENYFNFTISSPVHVFNKGFSGDQTTNGLARMLSDTVKYDAVIISYGYNDANGYGQGGYQYAITPQQYRMNLLRMVRLWQKRGSAVVLMSEPNTLDNYQNSRITFYNQQMEEVAKSEGVPYVNGNRQVNWIQGFSDGLHPDDKTYVEMGWHLAGLFLPQNFNHNVDASPGREFFATDNDWIFQDVDGSRVIRSANSNSKSKDKFVIKLKNSSTSSPEQGALIVYTLDVKQKCRLYLKLINPIGGVSGSVSVYYAGNLYKAIPPFVPQAGITDPQKFYIMTLEPGIRTLIFRNESTAISYIESIGFEIPDQTTIGGLYFKGDSIGHGTNTPTAFYDMNKIVYPGNTTNLNNWSWSVDPAGWNLKLGMFHSGGGIDYRFNHTVGGTVYNSLSFIGGRVHIRSTSDDGSGAVLQVGGTVSGQPATAPTNFVTLSQVKKIDDNGNTNWPLRTVTAQGNVLEYDSGTSLWKWIHEVNGTTTKDQATLTTDANGNRSFVVSATSIAIP